MVFSVVFKYGSKKQLAIGGKVQCNSFLLSQVHYYTKYSRRSKQSVSRRKLNETCKVYRTFEHKTEHKFK